MEMKELKQNLRIGDDVYRLRHVLKGWNAEKLASNLLSRHALQGRKSAIIIDKDNLLFFSQRGKKKWQTI